MSALLTTPYGAHGIRVNTVKDVSAEKFISAYAAHLKAGAKFSLPEWVDYVKTSKAKELAPYDPDWLYVRAAAIIRHLYFRPDQGVGAFKKIYSTNRNNGAAPGHSTKASGGCIRYCLQQFQEMGLVHVGANGGRRLTNLGHQEINLIARQCAQEEEEEEE